MHLYRAFERFFAWVIHIYTILKEKLAHLFFMTSNSSWSGSKGNYRLITPVSNCLRTSKWTSPVRVSLKPHTQTHYNMCPQPKFCLNLKLSVFQRVMRTRPTLSHGRRWSVSLSWLSTPSPRRSPGRRRASSDPSVPSLKKNCWGVNDFFLPYELYSSHSKPLYVQVSFYFYFISVSLSFSSLFHRYLEELSNFLFCL